MSLVISELREEGYEKILKIEDATCGLKAFIAIHNTALGPALGGIRFYPYSSEELALNDVKRLSRGMTYKAAGADLGLGGGKSVVMVDPSKKTKEMLISLGKAVEMLGGQYISAADYGCTMDDISFLKSQTNFVVGGVYKNGSGDPGPFTAWGVVVAMKATLCHLYGSESFDGKTVAIQGLGSVGFKIAEHLFWLGATLVVADPCQQKTKAAQEKFGAKVVSVDEIMSTECTLFAPCALGAILNASSIPRLRCKAVVGCANNQLSREEDAELLKEREILYAPDFIVNSGGLINVTFEIDENGYNARLSKLKIDKIYSTLTQIYQLAEELNCTTQKAVASLVEYRIKHEIGKREKPLYFHDSIFA